MDSTGSGKKEEEVELTLEDIAKLLDGVEPKDFEAKLKEAGIFDFRIILKHIKMYKESKEEKMPPVVSIFYCYRSQNVCVYQCDQMI